MLEEELSKIEEKAKNLKNQFTEYVDEGNVEGLVEVAREALELVGESLKLSCDPMCPGYDHL